MGGGVILLGFARWPDGGSDPGICTPEKLKLAAGLFT
jgi:hypothetical protein